MFLFVFVCFLLDRLHQFGFVFSNLVLLGLVFSVPSQEIGWEERLGNYLFCDDCDVKPYSAQIILCHEFGDRGFPAPSSVYTTSGVAMGWAG